VVTTRGNFSAQREGMPPRDLDATPEFVLLEVSPEERRRWRASFGASSLIQIPIILLTIWFFIAGPPTPREPEGTHHVAVTLLTPPPAATPLPKRVLHFPPPRPQTQVAEPTTPRLVLPREARVIPPKPSQTLVPLPQTPAIVPPKTAWFKPAVPKWKPQTHVGTFESNRTVATVLPMRKPQAHAGGFDSSRAVATVKLPPREVQTGGFGNPHGFSGEAKNDGNVAKLGSFDRPEGPGSGNGTGGANGARGLVASAGFGNGVATGSNSTEASGTDQTHSAGFADVHSMTRAPSRPKSQAEVAPFVPVEITSKPDPVYSDEARRLHIQGEVILRVDFTASGQVQILGVERRLGHGLDDAAARAAQEIQFKPARRNGRPVDTDATLHILFRLAD
jgi:TonB family protein